MSIMSRFFAIRPPSPFFYIGDIIWVVVFTVGVISGYLMYKTACRDLEWFESQKVNGTLLRDAREVKWHESVRFSKQILGLCVGVVRLISRPDELLPTEIWTIASMTTCLAVVWSILLTWSSVRAMYYRQQTRFDYVARKSGIKRTRTGDTNY